MKPFPLCAECYREYTNPKDRRYHAQPVACPDCGPQTYIVSKDGGMIADPDLRKTVDILKDGKVVAIKSLGVTSWLAMLSMRQQLID